MHTEPKELMNVSPIEPEVVYQWLPHQRGLRGLIEGSYSEEKRCKRLQKEKGILQKQVLYMRKKLVEMRKLKDKSLKRESRWMARPSQGPREKTKQKGNQETVSREKVSSLVRDENSFLLAGKKDVIIKNKQKMQRRVLTKPLNELHTQYQTEMEHHFSMSYRQFFRYQPFYITEPKSRDRDTSVCVAHENMRLLVQKLAIKGLLKTTSISELLSMIVCDLRKKACMDCMCPKCCFDKVELPELECAEVSWERVRSSNGEKTFANVVKHTHTQVQYNNSKSSSKESLKKLLSISTVQKIHSPTLKLFYMLTFLRTMPASCIERSSHSISEVVESRQPSIQLFSTL